MQDMASPNVRLPPANEILLLRGKEGDNTSSVSLPELPLERKVSLLAALPDTSVSVAVWNVINCTLVSCSANFASVACRAFPQLLYEGFSWPMLFQCDYEQGALQGTVCIARKSAHCSLPR